MRALRLLLVPALLLAAACQKEPPRYVSADDACSFRELSGWETTRDKGTLLLRDESGSRATIAVRSVAAEGDWVQPRTPALVVPATFKVLRALPGATVVGPIPVRARIDGVSFDAVFTPPGKHEPYLRRHAVLFGDDSGRVFHVVLTVPQASADTVARTFEQVIDSFEEEV